MRSAESKKLFLIFLVVWTLWNSVWVYPLRMLVVLFHEMSHGMAALLTGGHVHRIVLDLGEGGFAETSGGWRWLILPAGYLGSMLWGAFLLKATATSRLKRPISLFMGALILIVTLIYVRSVVGCLVGALFGAGLLLAGWKLSHRVNEWLLSTIGLTSMMYAVFDIKDDLISRTVPGSDAYQMSQLIPLPPVVWGLLWISLALTATALVLRSVLRSR